MRRGQRCDASDCSVGSAGRAALSTTGSSTSSWRKRLGGLHSALILLYSVDFADIAALQAEGRWSRGRARSSLPAPSRSKPAAPSSCCCAPTPCTSSSDQIESAVSIPLLHLVDVTARQSGTPVCTRWGCSAPHSRWTRRSTPSGSRPRDRGADASDRAQSSCTGSSTTSSASASSPSARRVSTTDGSSGAVSRGAQGIILGCTEIELLICPAHSPVARLPHDAAARGCRCARRAPNERRRGALG